MSLTPADLSAVVQALQPEFDKLNNKIDRSNSANRKDHNSIMKYLDERDTRLENKINTLEAKSAFPPFKNV